ncbi:MAG: DUF2357 domain-containing protein, partial [Clostridia bacterium]|nr:DUF2357 domain-containing protein [Clostridia bacterium]
EEVYNLAYGFLSRTGIYAGLQKEHQPTQAEFYAIFRVLREQLCQALEYLQTRPHHRIVSVKRIVAPEKVKRGGHKTAQWLAKRHYLFESEKDGLLAVNGREFTPRKVPDAKKELTYDTYENRFLKWLLQQLELKLRRFGEQCRKYKIDQRVIAEVDKMRNYLCRYSRNFFLEGVSKLKRIEHSSLVIQMAPGYRDVYRCYLMMLKGLNISSDIFSISLKGMAELYEYWCFLKLNSLLRKKYRLESHDLIAVDRTGLVFDLKKGKESTMKYFDPRNGEHFTISYNRFFRDLPTISQKPDNVLQLEKKGSKHKYQYIFDAKYRICVDKEYIEKFNQAGPPEDTINAMHRYRDAIIHSETDLKRDVFGAFVLFPHNNELAYAGKIEGEPSRFYESIQQVGIGALPFLPGQTILVEQLLDELILEGPDSAFERTVLQEGTAEYLTRDDKRSVLIGPFRTKDQLSICLRHNMYYTYLKEVQRYLNQLEYVALYQSKRLFKNEAEQGIIYYGKIKDYTVLPRKEIREAPSGNKPNALAVRFEVESWVRRITPIKPGRYGPRGPQRTSWELFKEAVIYPELHLTEAEIRLWRELKRFGECVGIEFSGEQIDEKDSMMSMEFQGLIIRNAGDGLFDVVAGGQSKQYRFSDLSRKPGKVLREIILFWQAKN